MKLADVVASTIFRHTCTIKRAVKAKQDGRFTRETWEEVYKDIPCAISTGGGSSETLNEEYQPVNYTDTLYTRPEIEVKAGDRVYSTVGENHVLYFEAGEGRKYVSHRQTPLFRRGRA